MLPADCTASSRRTPPLGTCSQPMLWSSCASMQPKEQPTAASSITTPITPVQLVAGRSSQPAHSSLACHGNMMQRRRHGWRGPDVHTSKYTFTAAICQRLRVFVPDQVQSHVCKRARARQPTPQSVRHRSGRSRYVLIPLTGGSYCNRSRQTTRSEVCKASP